MTEFEKDRTEQSASDKNRSEDEHKNTIKRKNSSNNNDALRAFFQKYGRYVAAAALFAVLIVIVVKFSGDGKAASADAVADTEALEEETETEELYSVNLYPEVNELITNYYNAYANGDTDTLSTLATPMSDNEKSFIGMYSQYVENYQNISCYTKSGLDDKSYMVSVYLEIKFAGVETLAPGLDFFYVQTNEDGSLYINNLYSQYNLLHKEQEQDSEIESLIDTFETQNDVIALQADVQSKYETAVSSDEGLNTMINTTIHDAYAAWSQALADAAAAAEEPATEEPAEEEPPAVEEPVAVEETVYATDTVNIRDAADESGNKVGQVTVGTALTRTGDAGNGWTAISYNGTTAYVKSEYLTNDANAVTGTADTSQTGKTVTLSESCNIRSSMSETADKVGVAYAGETVTVQEEYAEGWSKVSWNGQTGYIRTDLLK